MTELSVSPYNPVAADVQRYKEWLLDLEASRSVHPDIPTSRWYRGDTFNVYTRVGPAYARIPRTPVVCLANIEADVPGRGALRQLLAMLDASAGELRARHVVFELVHNPRLAKFLDAQGFRRWGLGDGDAPSFTRELPTKSRAPADRGA